MTREQTSKIEAAVLDVLRKHPLTISEACVELHRRAALPPYWGYSNLGAVIRRLYRRGALTRFALPGVTKSVLWWSD